jgi:hypothetical protein
MATKPTTAKKPRAKKVVAAPAPEAPVTLVAFKGFDKDFRCRGYQYAVGQTYTHDGPVVQCESGFHACQNPLDVLDFYDFANGNRFAKVTLSGKVDRSDDKKWAAAQITVQAELALPDFIKAGIAWIAAACKADDKTEFTSGDYAKNASSGDYAKNASSGHYAKNASSGHYATNASSGDSATNEASGPHAVIAAAGQDNLAKGATGVWIALAEYARVDGKVICIGFATGQAGHDGVPADTWLRARGGKLEAA